MLLNQILLSCCFCKNPYSTRRHRSQRRHEYNFTLRATILTDMKAPLAYCSKATKKMCAARAKNSWNRGLHLSAGRAKKTGKGSPLSAVTLQKIDKHATEASQKLNYAHSQWNFSEYTVQGEPWPKKMLEQNATTGNSIVLIKSIFLWNVKWVIGCVSWYWDVPHLKIP